MGTDSEILGSALRLMGETGGGCSLVYTEAVLHEAMPRVMVVFTDAIGAAAALKSAAAWAKQLNFGINLIVPHVVPYPLSASSPSVPIEFTLTEIRRLTAASEVEADVHIYLCRDRLQLLSQVLPPRSTVVIGVRKTWLPSAANRLARRLRKFGHVAIVAYA